ncbi:LysR family transcriptional regulator [Marinospirillum insulare]|uniref:LysR family transcriptional regulator n=1 Tax=Marinospirillum insulare TaxID=217169 RepID=A0ABQ5ZXR9_9GAMM|nr:LysR family transcriptional regulator [Marinospirillum insulare]GLR63810.1 LysR family transcriptional regulator [Marinospirillum insulare]
MQPLPDFEAWAIFATIAREGSFAKAAKVLGVSQATVSKAITRLEERTKTTLFHRTSRGISLTESGYSALEGANDLLNRGKEVEADIKEQSENLRGLIRISSPMSFGQSNLAPLLPDFLEMHPDIEIDIQFNDQQVDLVTGRFDFSLRIANLADSSLLARRLCPIQILLVGSPAYFAKHGTPKHPSDLADHQALLYTYDNYGSNWRFTHTQEGEFSQTLPPSRLRANNGDALQPALKHGLGLALQPDFLVWEGLQSGELVQVMSDWKVPPLALYIVTPPGRLRPARVNALIEYLIKHLSSAPWNKLVAS